MRILHLVHQYPPDFLGGTELYTQAIARAQVALGHEVTVVYRRWAEGEGQTLRDDEGVRVWALWQGHFTPSRRLFATFTAPYLDRAVATILETSQPDLVHLQHLMAFPASIGRSLRRLNLPVVATLHDYWWFCANAQLLTNGRQELCDGPRAYMNCADCALARVGHPEWWPLKPSLAGLFARRAQLLRRVWPSVRLWIAPTSFVRDVYVRHGLPAKRVEVLHHGWFEAPPASDATPVGPSGPVRFAYVGGLAWQKGLHVLIEAFKGVRGDVELWIAGGAADPDYAAQLQAAAPPSVRFLGQVPHETVASLLKEANAVVVPSLWYETFSLLISEAFAAGRPVLASGLGGLADRVRHGVDGLLIPPGDVAAWRAALQRLVDTPAYLDELKRNVVPPVTLSAHVEALSALYQQAIAR